MSIYLSILLILVSTFCLLPAAPDDGKVDGEALPRRNLRLHRRGRRYAQHRQERSTPDQQAIREVQFCTNACPSAKNGKCEDGSLLFKQSLGQLVLSPIERILCDLGTDCADCGGPHHSQPSSGEAARSAALRHNPDASSMPPILPPESSPMEILRAKDVEVFAARTNTQPPFLMPFTSAKADFDVSGSMHHHRLVEPLYNLYWRRLTEKCCAADGLVLDVGANFGYYSLYAAHLGCRVIAWEPVPVFRAFLRLGLELNNLSHRVHVRGAVVSNESGRTVSLLVPERGIWGTASVSGLNVDPSVRSSTYTIGVRTETLDDVVHEPACAMKLDVEGYEPAVVQGAKRVLKDVAPRMVLKEYTPGVSERGARVAQAREYPASLVALAGAGYRMWHLLGVSKHHVEASDWATCALPPLREVTASSLAAEVKNAENMIQDNLNGAGFSVPWDVHPRSLRAEFAHNTDLLLTLDQGAIEKRGEVGIWEDTPFGLGGGVCRDVRRDGTAAELLGRLCVMAKRNESIAEAIAFAEAPRPLRPGDARHSLVFKQARKWKLTGRRGSADRELVTRDDSRGSAQHGERGGGRRHGRGRAGGAWRQLGRGLT